MVKQGSCIPWSLYFAFIGFVDNLLRVGSALSTGNTTVNRTVHVLPLMESMHSLGAPDEIRVPMPSDGKSLQEKRTQGRETRNERARLERRSNTGVVHKSLSGCSRALSKECGRSLLRTKEGNIQLGPINSSTCLHSSDTTL